MLIISNINKYFENKLDKLRCEETTKAYITSIFSKYKSQNFDYSGESITLLYSKAKTENNFLIFQNVGDWLFFCKTLYPDYLNDASPEYFDTVAQLSYYSCYKMINKKWVLYENLADDFTYLTRQSRKLLNQS